MKKSTIAALVLLAAGLVCCLAAAGMGVRTVFLGERSSLHMFRYQEKAENIELPENVYTMSANRLVLDIDTAELTIQDGDKWSLSGGKDVTCEMEGDTLTIKQKNRSSWWYKPNPAPIVLTIPTDKPFYTVDVDVDAGRVEISDISATGYIKCDVDAGYIRAEDIWTPQIEASVDAGIIEILGGVDGRGAQGTPVKLDCNAGQILLNLYEGSTIGHVSGEVDMGDVKIAVNGENCLTDSGISREFACDIPGVSGTDLMTIDCDIGSIEVYIEASAASDAA